MEIDPDARATDQPLDEEPRETNAEQTQRNQEKKKEERERERGKGKGGGSMEALTS